jgi:hypothetical protein
MMIKRPLQQVNCWITTIDVPFIAPLKTSLLVPPRAIAAIAAIALATATTGFLETSPASAQTQGPCTYQCDSNQIRFVPGQPITIEFVNNTQGLVNLERVLDIDMQWLRPNSDFAIQTLVGADDDMSMVFWDDQNRAVNAVLHRPDAQTLRVELLPSGDSGDHVVHVSNDGRVLLY